MTSGGAAINNFTAGERGLEAYIPGYDSKTQAAKAESIVFYLNGEFKMRKLNPQRIFSMADHNRSSQVQFSVCLNALGKMITDLSPEFLNEIPIAL